MRDFIRDRLIIKGEVVVVWVADFRNKDVSISTGSRIGTYLTDPSVFDIMIGTIANNDPKNGRARKGPILLSIDYFGFGHL